MVLEVVLPLGKLCKHSRKGGGEGRGREHQEMNHQCKCRYFFTNKVITILIKYNKIIKQYIR